jgi:hypothetical protein
MWKHKIKEIEIHKTLVDAKVTREGGGENSLLRVWHKILLIMECHFQEAVVNIHRHNTGSCHLLVTDYI